MKQTSVYVLVKETNSGVPNLVVTAYDTENSIQEIIGVKVFSFINSVGQHPIIPVLYIDLINEGI